MRISLGKKNICILVLVSMNGFALHAKEPSVVTKNIRRQQTTGKVIAIGDLHGDLAQTKKALMLAGAIDTNYRWVGNNLVVVQTGDQIDRWHEDREILDLLDRLVPEAEEHGSHLVVLNGNHEIMNVDLDMRYVTREAFRKFSDFPLLPGIDHKPIQLSNGSVYAIPGVMILRQNPGVLNRASAFYPNQPYARLLAKRPYYVIINDTLFVHGGILPEDVTYGLEKINDEMHAWLTGKLASIPRKLSSPGPLWNRTFSNPGELSKETCNLLSRTLDAAGVKRMVVGHTIQPSINSACAGKVWRIDIGMSEAYSRQKNVKNRVEVLEIDGQNVKVLTKLRDKTEL